MAFGCRLPATAPCRERLCQRRVVGVTVLLVAIALYVVALCMLCGLMGVNRREEEAAERFLDAMEARSVETQLRAHGWD